MIHFPPRRYTLLCSLNFINNPLTQKRKINFKQDSSFLRSGNKRLGLNRRNLYLNKNKKNSSKNLLSTNTKSIKNSSAFQTMNKKVMLKYNDFELNSFTYGKAILNDKRTCCQYYFSLIKKKNAILFSFCPRKDYNSFIIRSCIFSLSFSIYYAINFAFFTDNIMHKIYEDGGKYDIFYFLPIISICSLASYYCTAFIKFIFLSEGNISQVRKQPTLSLAYKTSNKVKKNLIIKYIIFFSFGIIFLVFFWMLLSSFGAVYSNTQMFIIKNTLISFAMSLFYPIFINILPCMFRMCSLKTKPKNHGCVYRISKFLQIL